MNSYHMAPAVLDYSFGAFLLGFGVVAVGAAAGMLCAWYFDRR